MAATVLFAITGGEVVPEIEMPVSGTIFELKKKIESVLNLKVERQTLRYDNEELINDRSTAYYDFKKNVATLVLHFKLLSGKQKFNILVKSNREEFNVKVKETTLVAELKNKIEKHSYSIKYLDFYHLSTKMDADDLPLSAYYVSEGSEIKVKHKFHPYY
ncbi:hypothetical protein LWI28_001051 [Acer negundo]|uniref:Ubiquitin-like domain-containing protein n=1 Tax=Acer negundo TaxID=4023 RepID=A0AAD5NL27_ACENE|nr:hypothetical protein LWI28_001051 [Acer negundo]KAK4843229.1 hypothetical protein QYF36_005568 [Acer negundo]